MSSQASQVGVMRQTVDYHPNIWGEYFVNYNFEEDKLDHAQQSQEIEELKKELRRELMPVVNQCSLSQKLNLVDSMERLGVGYHFELEIQQLLQYLYDTNYHINDDSNQHDIYTDALCFRLLRQHGYNVSCDMFNKFKDDKGNFKESLASDVQGMLSLYEAAHLGVQGENILDEAICFTTTHLQAMATHCGDIPLASQVTHALYLPLHKRVLRAEFRHYISVHEDLPSQNQTLLKLAKLDFNRVQLLHKKELSEFAKWWRNLDFARKLPYARDRVVESYFWMLALYYEPQYSLQRRILTKGALVACNLDDTYDLYGTPEELKLFTEAIQRWDVSAMDQLPEYMQVLYKAILDFYDEIEEELAIKGWPFRIHYAKEALKMLVRSYLEESTWLRDNRIPTMEEYMGPALVTSDYTFFLFLAYSCMDCQITEEALKLMLSRPPIVKCGEFIGRVLNDLKSHEFEQQREHIPSCVECYVKQYGVSEEYAIEELNKQVNNAWKNLNEEFLKLVADLPIPMLMPIINLAQVSQLFYDDDDLYTRVDEKMKAYIESVLVDPIPI